MKRIFKQASVLLSIVLFSVALLNCASPVFAAGPTTSVTITKYDPYGNVIAQETVDYEYMECNLPVYGDGITHYYHQGPTFDSADLWDPGEMVNVDSRDYGAAMGTDVKDLCEIVGGASSGDTIRVRAADNFAKWFDYEDVYSPEPEQGRMVVCWYNESFGGYVPDYSTGMRLIFFSETLTPDGKYVFGNWDMHETLPASRWHYYYDGNFWPSSSGLSVQTVSNIDIFQPGLVSCNALGEADEDFYPGETVYVKARGLAAETDYSIWIQDREIINNDNLSSAGDPSAGQEMVRTDGNGDFGPVAVWVIDTAATSADYDIVADNQAQGEPAKYESGCDEIDNPGWKGFAVVAGSVPPAADFSADVISGVVPLSVNFSDQSSGQPASWAWDFDNDGDVDSSMRNPSYTYTEPGTYTVKLVVSNAAGSDEEVRTDYIAVMPAVPPTAAFSNDVISGAAPLTVSFTDQSSGQPTSWAWDFDNDGNVDSNLRSPSYTYTEPGVYTVKLTVSNAAGSDEEVKENHISVSEPELTLLWGPYLTNTTTSETIINLKTSLPTNATVEYAAETDYVATGSYDCSCSDGLYTDLHHIPLTGLEPGTAYRYRVIYGAESTEDYVFRTFPSSGPITFAVYSDSQDQLPLFSQAERHKLVADRIAEESDVLFVLHAGDLVNDGNSLADWNRYFDAARLMMSGTTVYPALGNHENDSLIYYEAFGLPSYYSFDCGDAHFSVLDSNDLSAVTSQAQWLEDDLATSGLWKFASFHHPMYTSEAEHFGGWVEVFTEWYDLFNSYAIDAVWNGHIHAYERFIDNDIPYCVIGTGGGPLYVLGEARYDGYQNSLEHSLAYARVTVDPDDDIATVQIIRVADIAPDNSQVTTLYPPGTVFETFVLAHPPAVDAGPDASVLSGEVFSLSAGFNDPGVNDSPWIYTIDWGDGSPSTTGTSDIQGSGVIEVFHQFSVPGTYDVLVTVSDNDGATGRDTLCVEVGPFSFTIDRMMINFTWLRPHTQDTIAASGSFHLPEGAVYDLNEDDVCIEIDGVSIVIPAGSFKKLGRWENYTYSSSWRGGPKVTMRLDFMRGDWSINVRDIDAGAVDNSDGVDVRLRIGSLTGAQHIEMRVDSLSSG
ncbi:MAG: PKD domain-containing protein [Dehalococcoidales bacterium]|nr:PKD domain-containing protein [Dehalococcoidales bacterium]